MKTLQDVIYGRGNYLGVNADKRIDTFYTLIRKYETDLTKRRDTPFTKFLAFFKADQWFQEKFGKATTDGGVFISKVNNMKQDLAAMKNESETEQDPILNKRNTPWI